MYIVFHLKLGLLWQEKSLVIWCFFCPAVFCHSWYQPSPSRQHFFGWDSNHPQMVRSSLLGFRHESSCSWCRYPETASHMAWSFLGIQPISGRSFLEIPWFFASPFLEDVPWKHHWITIKWVFPPYHGCFTIKPPFFWGFPTANRQLNPPIDTLKTTTCAPHLPLPRVDPWRHLQTAEQVVVWRGKVGIQHDATIGMSGASC